MEMEVPMWVSEMTYGIYERAGSRESRKRERGGAGRGRRVGGAVCGGPIQRFKKQKSIQRVWRWAATALQIPSHLTTRQRINPGKLPQLSHQRPISRFTSVWWNPWAMSPKVLLQTWLLETFSASYVDRHIQTAHLSLPMALPEPTVPSLCAQLMNIFNMMSKNP